MNPTTTYRQYLRDKIRISPDHGFEIKPGRVHDSSMPHQRDTITWAIRKGRALIAKSFGLGKTHVQIELMRLIHEQTEGKTLIICPLGVKHQFTAEDGPRLGVDIQYVRTDAEVEAATTPYLITNYERVRDGGISPGHFVAVTLDEGSVLRSMGTKTTQQFIRLFRDTPYRYVCTATPSPNNYVELIHYAHFLGVMDASQILSRWFKRDSTKAHNASLHPQHEDDFWMWVNSWALFLTKPSDLGYSDEGYDLPPLQVHWHRVASTTVHVSKDGQSEAFASVAGDLRKAAKEKRSSLVNRIAKAKEITEEAERNNPDPEPLHWLLWHHLEDERRALEQSVPFCQSVYGAMDLDKREERILDFSRGKIDILATKPEISGSGCNFQKHCHSNIFLGINYKFQDFIQAIHRTHRFQQTHPVDVHIIYTDAEEAIRKELEAKWKRHDQLMKRMQQIIKKYGLSHTDELRKINRKMGIDNRQIKQGLNYTCVLNDCVAEMGHIEDNSIGLIHTSIPFSNQFEYSANYADFGHNYDDKSFFDQMGYAIPEWLRVLMPGRLAVIHVKDRIEYGNMTGLGMTSLNRFSDKTADCFEQHGFIPMGRITIVTDVVRENNQTYRLGWAEQCKDGSKMGAGLPEYLLIFRKPPTDQGNAYADLPVQKTKEEYTRGRWQIDAHGFWRSNGNRLLTRDDLARLSHSAIIKWFKERNLNGVYDYEEHVQVCEQLDEMRKLPTSFMLCPPQSWHPDVWTDVTYVNTLNSRQTQKRLQNHVCPLPIDIPKRVINRYSNPGEVVLDPFGGLMTVPWVAVRSGRKGYGVELCEDYWKWGAQYCRDEELKQKIPTLFDLIQNQPPYAEASGDKKEEMV